jgi:predicted DNA-binding antitoxin AbrB/MazE fold protein
VAHEEYTIMKTVSAIYEDGVFRPTQPVDLPERCHVHIDVHVQPASNGSEPSADSAQGSDREFDPRARPLEEIIAEIAAKVPPEAWDTLPDDLSDNLDHYLYGTPRNEEGVR